MANETENSPGKNENRAPSARLKGQENENADTKTILQST